MPQSKPLHALLTSTTHTVRTATKAPLHPPLFIGGGGGGGGGEHRSQQGVLFDPDGCGDTEPTGDPGWLAAFEAERQSLAGEDEHVPF